MNNDRNIKENDGGSIGSTLREMRTFLLLWLTQSFSGLGSAMTSYALVIWSYTQKGSALMTALLMVSSYAPYVLLSIFAGALSDRWNKKATMLVCDIGEGVRRSQLPAVFHDSHRVFPGRVPGGSGV